MRKMVLSSLIQCLLVVAATSTSAHAQDAGPVSTPAAKQSASTAQSASSQPGSAHSTSSQASTAQSAHAEPASVSSAAANVSTQAPSSISDQAAVLPATTRAQVVQRAKANAGRTDPLAPVEGFKPFPSGSAATAADAKAYANKTPTKMLIPPPPGGLQLQVPPPPPTLGSHASSAEDLPVSELPVPPERPSIVNKLKLTGIIGQKAIFTITDLSARRLNKWPRSLMLGTGEHFESVEVVSIGSDSALLEENGEQTTKRLERIR
jgi:hypothetical protein